MTLLKTNTKNKKIIQKGAEAIIILQDNKIVKKRTRKSYRIKELDEKIRKLRTRNEGKLLEKASKILNIPKIIKIDEKNKEILMQFIKGKKLSEHLDSFPLNYQKKICRVLGEEIGKLHNLNIIHGDLTTSNMICDSASLHTLHPKIFFIDFGLGFISHKIEDKAVDLHLLKQALEAKHFKNWKILFKKLVKEYSKYDNSKKILEQLKKVEKRGRYKKH